MTDVRSAIWLFVTAGACLFGVAPAWGQAGMDLRPPEPPPTIGSSRGDFPPLQRSLTLAEAVHRALSANTGVVVQRLQVMAGEGGVQQAEGAYDTEAQISASNEKGSHPLRKVDVDTFKTAGRPGERADYRDNTEYRVAATRLLRSGVELEGAVSVNSAASTLNDVSNIYRQTNSSVRFGVRVPLVRNFGGIQQASALAAQELERDASIEDLLQTSSATVLAVTQGYWELAARLRRIEILKASERRANELIAEIGKLVAADQIPGAELDLAQASAGEKRVSRLAEEQALQAAWTALGRQLHADTGDELDGASLNVGQLPEVGNTVDEIASRLLARRQDAVERRSDVRAARYRERAAQQQLAAAQNGLKPQVDLVAAVTNNGLAEGTASPAFEFGRYASTNIGVQLRVPFENNAARGLVTSRLAAYRQALARLHEVESGVAPAIVAAASNLRRIVSRYRDTAAAVELYDQSVQNEYTKRRLGLATLIDVINVQDRLDNARLLLLQLRQEYAGAVAQLLFESGDLVRRSDDAYHIDLVTLGGAGMTRAR